MNFSWSDISELDEPAYTVVIGPRLGKNITFKNPERSLAIWAGGFRVKLNSGTNGNISTTNLFPTEEWGRKIDTGYIKVAESQQKVDTRWAGLTAAEQKNPVNTAKHQSANAALARAGGILDQATDAVSNIGNSTIQYSLDKKPKEMWNFIIGSQFQ